MIPDVSPASHPFFCSNSPEIIPRIKNKKIPIIKVVMKTEFLDDEITWLCKSNV